MNVPKRIIRTENASSKSFCDNCSKNRCHRNESAKAYTVWNTRNNSSNVSSLLAPDFCEESTSTMSNRSYVQRRCIKSAVLSEHCEDCYCRDSPNLPLLDLRPKWEEQCKKADMRRNMINRPKRSHGVERVPKDYNPRMIHYPQRREEEASKSNLTFTDSRGDYEARIVENGESEKPNHEKDEVKMSGDHENDEKPMTYKDFKELADFRKEQYFDCHSCSNIATPEPIAPHKCVHKFVINDRLLPEPLNSDCFGLSRCGICNKPMESLRNDESSSNSKKSANKMKEIYEQNLTPPRLSIGRGQEIIQIKVPEKVRKECLREAPSFKITRRVPGNSLALRFQKGCL